MAKLVDATDLIRLGLGMGNSPSENFQIQRNSGINKRGQSWAKSCFLKAKVQKVKKRDRCRDSMEAVLTNGVGCGSREVFPSKIQKNSVK